MLKQVEGSAVGIQRRTKENSYHISDELAFQSLVPFHFLPRETAGHSLLVVADVTIPTKAHEVLRVAV